jgi:hypothetical protein
MTIVADKSEITIRFAAAQSASEKHVEPVAAYGIPMEILALGLSPRDAFGRTLAPFG